MALLATLPVLGFPVGYSHVICFTECRTGAGLSERCTKSRDPTESCCLRSRPTRLWMKRNDTSSCIIRTRPASIGVVLRKAWGKPDAV